MECVPVLPRPARREFEFPGIKVAARLAAGSEPRSGPGPGARGGSRGLGRWPQAMAAPGTSGSAAAVATPRLQLSRRVAGERRVEGEGSGEGKGSARLWVPCACAERRRAVPRALLCAGSAPTGRLLGCWPPPRLATGAKAHQRRASRSGVPSGRPLAAGRSLAATSGTRGALQKSRGSAPPRSMPGAGSPRPARLSARPPSDAFPRSASRPQPAPGSPEPPPPLKCAINFPSLPPPRAAPAAQTPPPDAPSLTSRLSSRLPPGRAFAGRPPPYTTGRQDP